MIWNDSLKFILLLGFVSLLADVTYEGARSIIGPFLSSLGANAFVVGSVAGLGELIGYGFRLLSGYASDKTQRYWLITFFGYILNLIAVPLLALTTSIFSASSLVIMERMGKAIRTPARDAMLSYATQEVGRGWGFGLHGALDQIGAVLGPLVIAILLFFHQIYATCFAILAIPAFFALMLLGLARTHYSNPQNFEKEKEPREKRFGKRKFLWQFLTAVSFIGAGYVDFALIAYHFQKTEIVAGRWIPVFYALAMGAQALGSLLFGRLYDSKGIFVIVGTTFLAAWFAPLVFWGGFYTALMGMFLWGLGMGALGTIMRAIVPSLVHIDQRGTAYGMFNVIFGIFWFLGSAAMGFLYECSITHVIIFSMIAQYSAIPFFLLLKSHL